MREKCLDGGDSCNTLQLNFSNHVGTHVDCPYHFDRQGKTLTDYPAEHWHCHNIQILHTDLEKAGLCSVEQMQQALEDSKYKNREAEALFLVTGWNKKRHDKSYWESPPGFSMEIADWLRDEFPALRFFGFDVISLSSYQHRELGRQAHRAFLCHERPIMIIEDMDLSPLDLSFQCQELLISPLMIQGADGAPCTIWAGGVFKK